MTVKRQWSLATAFICLLVLIAGYMVLVRPQHSKAASVRTQTTAVQGEITQLRAQLATLVAESKNIATQEAALAAIERQLPSTPDEPDLLMNLDAAAKKDGVDLENVAPGNPTAYSYTPVATASSSSSSSAGATAVPGLAVIPVALTVTGSYAQLESFLDDIEKLPRSMLVNTFTLSYAGTAGTAKATGPVVGDGEISATINAEVFMSTADLGSTTLTPSASASSGATS
jgi:Tfp pilus assembly protein PilO